MSFRSMAIINKDACFVKTKSAHFAAMLKIAMPVK